MHNIYFVSSAEGDVLAYLVRLGEGVRTTKGGRAGGGVQSWRPLRWCPLLIVGRAVGEDNNNGTVSCRGYQARLIYRR